MRIYIICDMEGISGIRRVEQTQTAQADYLATGRKFLTGDVNAAIAGAFDGGATEVIVNEWHGGSCHLLLDEADPRAQYERTAGGLEVLPALSADFSGVFFVGCHAMAGTPKAFLDHTMNDTVWYNYYVNGRRMGEIAQCALIAGHFGVPMLMVTGDRAACVEAHEFLGEQVVTVAVKEALNRSFARIISPVRSQEMIREGACRAMGLAGQLAPLTVDMPATIRLEYTRTDYADTAATRRHVRRVAPRAVEATVDSMLDVYPF